MAAPGPKCGHVQYAPWREGRINLYCVKPLGHDDRHLHDVHPSVARCLAKTGSCSPQQHVDGYAYRCSLVLGHLDQHEDQTSNPPETYRWS
jgi:hypothetical protein